MRQRTVEDYAARIDRALSLLVDTQPGDAPPTLAQLAEAAALSPFHFHRVFRLMTGETVGAACQRLRLARSLPGLADPACSVTDASSGTGYATTQAFARALRQRADTSASEARADGEVSRRLDDTLRKGAAREAPLAIEVVSLAPFRVVALRRKGPYEALDEGYEALFTAVFADLPESALTGIWGVPLDDPLTVAPNSLAFECALDVGPAAPQGSSLTAMELGGGAFLRAHYVGSYDEIHLLIDELYRAALGAEDVILGEMPPLVHYRDQPEDAPPEQLRSDIFLAVRPA